jgi:hypothetical protein
MKHKVLIAVRSIAQPDDTINTLANLIFSADE